MQSTDMVLPPDDSAHQKLALACALLVFAPLAGCQRGESLDARWVLSTASQPQHPQGDQWAGHRGGTLHAVAEAQTLPVHFGHNRNVCWVVDLAGTGNSSPTVYGDRVFLTVQRPGKTPQLELLCLDRRHGTLRWRRSIGAAIGTTHRRNGYASATVATDGQRVYATFGRLGVFCFSVTGEPLWHVALDFLEHTWGHASSPVLSGDLVIQLADGERESRLLAMNCYTGDIVWSTERVSSGCWATPVLVPVADSTSTRWEIVVNGTGSTNGSPGCVIAYAPESGRELWRVRGTSDIPCPTAIVGESLVISTSGRNGPVIAIRPGGEGEVTATHVSWQLPRGGSFVPTGVIKNSRLYLLSDSGMLRCQQVDTGTTLWEKRLRRSYSASLVAGDGKLYATSENGDIHVFSTDETGTLLAVNRLGQRCLATPAIAHGELFVRTRTQLFCFASKPALVTEDAAPPPDTTAVTIPVSLARPE
jgi:outer membrane protein assembly factor BamB